MENVERPPVFNHVNVELRIILNELFLVEASTKDFSFFGAYLFVGRRQ